MSVSVLIPAYNEEKQIKATIETASNLAEVEEVIVIDDGSGDKTYHQALQTEAKVIQSPVNQGKGAALNRGLKMVQEDIILLLDADLGKSAREAKKLLNPLLEGEVDMTVAKFITPSQKGGFGLVKRLATWGLRIITGRCFAAPLSGQRAVTKEVIREIKEFAPGFGVEVGLTIAAFRAGFKIKEVPVNMRHRFTGRDLKGFWHRGRQFKDIVIILASQLRT
ncbi:MAG: glycosyltransferase family 2 protein [Halanaerobacter sp.]